MVAPTYRLLIGIPGKSNAFAISRRLGLPEDVIAAAQEQMSGESVRFEDILTQLEEKRQALEKREQEADRLLRQREEDARRAREFREQMEHPTGIPHLIGAVRQSPHTPRSRRAGRLMPHRGDRLRLTSASPR